MNEISVILRDEFEVGGDYMSNQAIKIFDNYNNILERFLNAFYDSNKSDLENWNNFFSNIDTWKTKYLVSTDKFTLNGVSGWYLDLYHYKFITDEATDYLPIISLICWSIEFDNGDYGFFKNQSFFDTLIREILCEENSLTSLTKLTKDSFLDELSDQYQKSYKRFEHYVNNKEVSTNPKVIAKLTPEYPRFVEFLDAFKSDLQECRIFRINDLGEDENVWYFIKKDDYTHVMLLQDFV